MQIRPNSQGSLLSPRGLDRGHHQKTLQSLVRSSDYYLWLLSGIRYPLITILWLLSVIGCSSWQHQNNMVVRGQSKETSGPWDNWLKNQECRCPSTRNNIDRNRQIHQVNVWLWGWCRQKNLGFFGHGMIYSTLVYWELTACTFLRGEKEF